MLVTKRTIGELIFDNINTGIMSLIALIFIYPFLYCLVASISVPARLALHEGLLFLPLGLSFESYASVFSNALILRGLLNTIFYVVVGTALNVVMTAFAAYVLSRKNFFWKKFIMFFIVLTMYFGGGLIPFYLLVKSLSLIETPWAMIIPTAMSAFNMIIMRTYFMSIPASMEESAVIDGANDFTILFRIILPLSMPVVAVMIIYYGVGRWNAWFHALIFLLKNQEWQPLQLILRNILLKNDAAKLIIKGADPTESQELARLIKYALIIITTVPIILIYPFMQKHFIKGVMIGSIKE